MSAADLVARMVETALTWVEARDHAELSRARWRSGGEPQWADHWKNVRAAESAMLDAAGAARALRGEARPDPLASLRAENERLRSKMHRLRTALAIAQEAAERRNHLLDRYAERRSWAVLAKANRIGPPTDEQIDASTFESVRARAVAQAFWQGVVAERAAKGGAK